MHERHFDMFGNILSWPTVLQLMALDGGTQHAVTVVGRLIFYSTCPHALDLNQQTLDYCCSTNTQPGQCARVHHGYCFKERDVGKVMRVDNFIHRKEVTPYM